MSDSEQLSDEARLRAVVAQGMQDALADKQTYERAFGAFKEYAQETASKEAGNFVLGWIKWVIGKVVLATVVIFILWYSGGMPAVLAYLKVKP